MMACPLSAILNPVIGSTLTDRVPNTGDDDDDDDSTVSEAATEIIDDEETADEEMPDKERSRFDNRTRHPRTLSAFDPGMANRSSPTQHTFCYPLLP